MTSLTRFSPAKVNLSLAVSGVRPDGYHDLDSVVALLTLGDDITLTRAEQTTLQVTSEHVDLSAMPEDCERNLAVRAVRLLEAAVGRPLPTAITIAKRIPLGGGLGGGSSNAATVLKGMAELWKLALTEADLVTLAAQLGSDVPLFLLDGTVRMRGRGERIERLAMAGAKPLNLVLANDGTHCPTPQIYRALDEIRGQNENFSFKGLTDGGHFCDTLCLSLREGKAEPAVQWVFNDLEMPCFAQFPGVRSTAEALRTAGCRGALLCGSGGTVCGIVDCAEDGERVLAHPALSKCWRASVQTLPDGVMAAHGPLTPIVMVRIHVGQPCPQRLS